MFNMWLKKSPVYRTSGMFLFNTTFFIQIFYLSLYKVRRKVREVSLKLREGQQNVTAQQPTSTLCTLTKKLYLFTKYNGL